MKLKYLLPAATIASAAAIVTPLVTSCAPKYTVINGLKDITEEEKSWAKSKKTTATPDEALAEYVTIKNVFNHDFKYYLNKGINKAFKDIEVLTGKYANVKISKTKEHWYGSWDFIASFKRPASGYYYNVKLESHVKQWPLTVAYIDIPFLSIAGNFIQANVDDAAKNLMLKNSSMSVKETEEMYTLTSKGKPGKFVLSTSNSGKWDKSTFDDAGSSLEDFMYGAFITMWMSHWFSETTITQ